MTIVFAGSFQHYSRLILQALLEQPRLEVVGVITTPPRPAGRRQQLTATPVHRLAEQNEVAVYTPEAVDAAALASSPLPVSDILLAAGYGRLFSPGWLEWPRRGALNLHFSLLPAYRGANPAEWALLAGQSQTGVTLIEMAPRFDTGRVLSQSRLSVAATDTRQSLYERLYQLAARQVIADLPRYLAGQLSPRPQPAGSPTPYARRFQRSDGRVTWTGLQMAMAGRPLPAGAVSPSLAEALAEDLSAVGLERAIRALAGQSQTSHKRGRLKLLTAHLSGPRLVLDEVQLEGRRPVRWAEFSKAILTEL